SICVANFYCRKNESTSNGRTTANNNNTAKMTDTANNDFDCEYSTANNNVDGSNGRTTTR
ncbi:hypothetical protein A2U01_0086631, partial [Trifolium medium]|nr:hypothetical protein [Trifolium medium]